MKKYIVAFIILAFFTKGFSQLVTSPFDTIKKYLAIDFAHSPNGGGFYRISLDDLRQNKFTNAHWAQAPFSKKFMQVLLLPPAQGGDQRLQEYVAYVLLMTRQKIHFNLVNDAAVALSAKAMTDFGVCSWDNQKLAIVSKSWPCAKTFGHPSMFDRTNCTQAPPSSWGGEFTIGEAFLDVYDLDQDYVRGTIVHELVHTQDWTDAAWQHFNSTAGFLVYGRDGTHYIDEVLPSKEYTFMEGLANSMSFNYSKAVDPAIKKMLIGDTFKVEIPPNPLVVRNTCNKTVPLSPDASIFIQLLSAGIDTVDRKFIPGAMSNYAYFSTKKLKPQDLFFHNENIIACIFGKCLHYVNKDRFLVGFNAENYVRDFLNALGPSAYLGTIRTLSRSMVSRDISLKLREMEEIGVAPPDQCLYPYALIDLLTYEKLTNYNDWKTFYSNSVSDYWINNYLRVKNAKLLKSGKLMTNPDDIATALGLNKIGLN